MKKLTSLLLFALIISYANAQEAKHTFCFRGTEFMLDGKPFQIISGEMHPARIPTEYWRHRIKMTKAMGCNTVSVYIFWNHHETQEGVYDFTTWNRELGKFIKIAEEEGLWVILRPGPYVCAEWDFGGIPPYLLKIPDIKIRCMDSRYMNAVENYLRHLAKVIKPFQITNGGPVLMLQIENEYGSYGNDREYIKKLASIWRDNGIDVPFFTGDGPTPYMLEAGSLEGCASGLDSGSSQADFDLASTINPNVPVFSSETYPGWLTHWGEKWAKPDTASLYKEIHFLMDSKKSFNLYVIHGGTNFGFTAGANSGGKGYEPDVTSYDYDAPINEQGQPTQKYFALRNIIGSYLPKNKKLPEVPEPIATIRIPEIRMEAFASVWDNLPIPIQLVQPKPFEALNQNQGYMVYRTRLIGHKSGKLTVTELHDYATVFLNGKYIGKMDRREGINTIEIPETKEKVPVLEILVEGMGHINFAQHIIDRKGITDRVTLNGMTLMNWNVFKLPMDDKFILNIKPSTNIDKEGIFFKGKFNIDKVADTYINMSNYIKGVVWVNGNNLGRYWNIGPQFRLYCPAIWLKKGENTIVVFDSHLTEPKTINGEESMD